MAHTVPISLSVRGSRVDGDNDDGLDDSECSESEYSIISTDTRREGASEREEGREGGRQVPLYCQPNLDVYLQMAMIPKWLSFTQVCMLSLLE